MGKDNKIYGSPWEGDLEETMAILAIRRKGYSVVGIVDAIVELARIETLEEKEAEANSSIYDRLENQVFQFEGKNERTWKIQI